jgi:hypothetical protein
VRKDWVQRTYVAADTALFWIPAFAGMTGKMQGGEGASVQLLGGNDRQNGSPDIRDAVKPIPIINTKPFIELLPRFGVNLAEDAFCPAF